MDAVRRYVAGLDGDRWRVLDTWTRQYIGPGYEVCYRTSRKAAMRFADMLERER